ncbi:MAG: hypothetical protein WAL31_00185 [Gaiellaceae bacterium]
MPSGKKSRQQRRAAPPPVRSASGGRRGGVSRRTLLIAGAVLVVVIGLGVGLPLALSSSGGGGGTSNQLAPLSTLGKLESPGPLGPPGPEVPPIESGPNLAPAGSPSPGQSVDGIQCQSGEQVAFHIHSRLTIFVDGHPRTVPYGVGIADPQLQPGLGIPFVARGACFSWLHTHAADGIIHVESPVQRTYTLGNFFDIWGQPLSRTQVGPAKGKVTALYNGRVWTGDPRDVPLNAHAQIQLEVGKPLVGPVRITDWGDL